MGMKQLQNIHARSLAHAILELNQFTLVACSRTLDALAYEVGRLSLALRRCLRCCLPESAAHLRPDCLRAAFLCSMELRPSSCPSSSQTEGWFSPSSCYGGELSANY